MTVTSAPASAATAAATATAAGATEHVDVLVVGAGFAGLGLGIRLARETTHTFVIVERADSVGGTWRDNTYPGVACDIPSHLYSFSFRQKPDWSSVYAPGAEIRAYLGECAREEGLLPHLRLATELLHARWSDDDGRWHVSTTGGDFTARALVTAAGRLSEPRFPAIDGLDTFPGPRFHTSRWNHDVDLTGKRVGITGTGASAVQVLPGVADVAAEVVVFQRSAPYVVPRHDRDYSEAEKTAFAGDPQLLDDSRSEIFRRAEETFPSRLGREPQLGAQRALWRNHLEAQIADPALREALTPDYEIGCKRVLVSNDYYPALGRPNVYLENAALTSFDGRTATASNGRSHDLDVLVFATGFHSTRQPYADRIAGRGGELLSAHWANGMTAYASTVVHGYPNLFIIDGPNASLGHNSAIHMIETQLAYVLGALEHLSGHPDAALDVRADAEAAYTDAIDAAAAETVWLTGGCRSWYVDDRSRRLTLLWPGYALTFREANGRFDAAPFG
ncbi:4-hydroxyacetophenone monooxygenase [Subtercola boreus]|uniref:4-hydroxyacetophenone monooxygenase n=1 Tax=Subtercola boreus TaxID=120213 RepID=A0A3E0VMY8_9MICO|nr:4-hydroxyacetophenone monooxygenase [Subtercola boreus]TQL56129.1 cation diffusion facilitator CzcD-associated flavoprotein CzcO [Subtercola boreus]